MKGKKISNYEFDIFNLMGGMTSNIFGAEDRRKNALTKETKEFTVDTCLAGDTGCWETGICSDKFNHGEWVIVDEYETRKKAKVGHEKWIKHMKTNPKELTDIHIDKTYKLIK